MTFKIGKFIYLLFGCLLALLAFYLFISETAVVSVSENLETTILISILLISLALTVSWTSPKQYAITLTKKQYVIQLIIRCFLSYIMFTYGISKLFGNQFFSLQHTLDTPLGQLSGIELTWRFFGYSASYGAFIASAQIIGAILLWFKRTTTFATIILLPVISNIVFVNYSHHIPVKEDAIIYLLMCIYLLLADYDRLKALFITNQKIDSRTYESLFINSRMNILAHILKYLVLSGLFVFAIHSEYDTFKRFSAQSIIDGAWQTADSPPTKYYFEKGNFGCIKGPDNEKEFFDYLIDDSKKQIAITFEDSSKNFSGQFILTKDKLIIHSQMDTTPIKLKRYIVISKN